jgi:hypothetical protein
MKEKLSSRDTENGAAMSAEKKRQSRNEKTGSPMLNRRESPWLFFGFIWLILNDVFERAGFSVKIAEAALSNDL